MANGSVLQADEFFYKVKVGIARRKMENQWLQVEWNQYG